MATEHLGSDERVFEREGILCLAWIYKNTDTQIIAYVINLVQYIIFCPPTKLPLEEAL